MDYRKYEGMGWVQFIRFHDISLGMVKSAGKRPEVGDVIRLLSASVQIEKVGKKGVSGVYEDFCDPDKPLRVVSVLPDYEYAKVTVYVEHVPNEKEPAQT